MNIRDLNDFNDISVKEWDELLSMAIDIKNNSEKYVDACKGLILASLFYEPSTRTMFSFQSAMLKLGGKVIGFTEPNNSSISKGEDFQDTIRVISGYADVIVIRHPLEGATKAAGLYSDVPIINAGDGGHLHPTQTLVDLTTIAIEKGEIKSLVVGICGDLKYGRTVHSLIKALSQFPDITFALISPESIATPDYLTEMLREKNIRFLVTDDLDSCLPDLDILYMTRIQRERFADLKEYEKVRGVYVLNAEKLKLAKPDMLIMHPLPRIDEIAHDVDDDKRAVYFKQAKYGLYIRMALILKMLSSRFDGQQKEGKQVDHLVCTNPKCISNHEHYLPKHFMELENDSEIYRCIYCDKQYKRSSEGL